MKPDNDNTVEWIDEQLESASSTIFIRLNRAEIKALRRLAQDQPGHQSPAAFARRIVKQYIYRNSPAGSKFFKGQL